MLETKAGPPLTIRPYEAGDETEILRTFNRVFRETNGPSYVDRELATWHWQFRDNPEGSRISLAVADDGTVAAQYAGVPLRVSTPLGQQTFVHIVDSFVHPEYRQGLKAPGLFVNTALPWFADCYRRGDAVPYGFPVPRAERIGQRYLHYNRLRVVDYLCRRLGCETNLQPPAGIAIARMDALDDEDLVSEVDGLFARFAAQRSCLTIRDAAYLRWRYLEAPSQPYEIWAARAFGSLLGWCVLRPQHELVPGACTIVDWVVPDRGPERPNSEVIDALLAMASRRAREEGRQTLLGVFADPAPECAEFRGRGFEVVPSGHTMERRLTYQIFNRELTEQFVTSNWWYTLGDSDLA